MNKIQVEGINKDEPYIIDKDVTIKMDNSDGVMHYKIINDSKVFLFIQSEKLKLYFDVNSSCKLNIFCLNNTLDIVVNLNKEGIVFDYAYSIINEINSKYNITINHLESDITSNIVSHGLNIGNGNLDFRVSAIVPKQSNNIITNQDSKILLNTETASISPNLIIDNDDVSANHSAYLGQFKDEELFYLQTRGISKENSIKLLAKAYLLRHMHISFRERNMILEIIKKYWR